MRSRQGRRVGGQAQERTEGIYLLIGRRVGSPGGWYLVLSIVIYRATVTIEDIRNRIDREGR
jgi:hypothetical protein